MFRLAEFRRDKKLTQKDVAEIFKCKQNNISIIENQKKDLTDTQLEALIVLYGDSVKSYIDDIDSVSIEKGRKPVVGDYLLPYYDVDITLGFDNIMNDQTTIPSYYLNIPAFKNCDCAVPVYGRSMTPDINDGSIVAIKEVSLDSVLPGEAYLIVTDEYRTVKYIRTCKGDPTKLRLVPKNLEEFDEMILDKSKIRKVFMVKGVITNKIL